MNINKNFGNEKKNWEERGVRIKLPFFLPAMCPSVSNLVPNHCLDIILSP